jgi:hypothetical protein
MSLKSLTFPEPPQRNKLTPYVFVAIVASIVAFAVLH